LLLLDSKVKQLQKILQITFGLIPIVAGLDKFTNLLTHWPDYLGAGVAGILPAGRRL
jgi:hypothetical protein